LFADIEGKACQVARPMHISGRHTHVLKRHAARAEDKNKGMLFASLREKYPGYRVHNCRVQARAYGYNIQGANLKKPAGKPLTLLRYGDARTARLLRTT